MKKLLLLIIVSAISTTAFTQPDSARKHARQLLEIMGSAKLADQMMSTMVASYREQLPDVPAAFWDNFLKEANTEELLDLIIPIYVKHFTDKELVQLINFYKTPLGQKVVSTLPIITQESYAAGEGWGRKLGEKVAKKLKEKGYIKGS